MKKIIIAIWSVFLISNLFGQTKPDNSFSRCLTMEALKSQFANNLEYTAYFNTVHQSNSYKNFRIPPLEPVVVPVAFHFSEGIVNCNNESCIIDEVDDQLRILNQAFADNTTSSLIQDCPAAYRDVNGNSVVSTGTNISFCYATPPLNNEQGLDAYCDLPITIGAFDGGTFVSAGVGAPNWDGILNIFITSNNCLGVADGIPGQAVADGVTVCAPAFGGIDGTSCNLGTDGTFNLGYTLVHEIGHYLGLYHTFEGACNDEPDSPGPYNVDDTPALSSDTSGCPSSCINGCNGPIATANFMDYTNDACMGVFSKDQALVMNFWANKLFGEFQYECSINQTLSSLNTICNSNNCPIICPTTVNNQVNIVEKYCGSATNISFPNPNANSLALNANSNGEVFVWSVDNYINQGGSIINAPVNLATTVCNIATQTYYLNVDCYNNPLSSPLPGGTYQIQVYPMPPNNLTTLVGITNQNGCNEPIITPVNNCDNYLTIVPSNTNPSFPVNADEIGIASYVLNFIANPNGSDCCNIATLEGEILENNDFELGNFKWLEIEEAPPGTPNNQPFGIIGISGGNSANMNGTNDAWLGSYFSNSLTAIEQNISIPECNTLNLKFDYKTVNCSNVDDMELSVYINSEPVATINCNSATNQAVATFGPIDINNNFTENAVIRFEAIENGANGGAILIDNISLQAKDCPVPPACSQEIAVNYNCTNNPCSFELNLNGAANASQIFKAENNIVSEAIINANVTYQAGEFIMLTNGFEANKDFDFETKIGSCN